MVMLKTMGGIFRSGRAANRMLSSVSGGVKSPWLMLRSDNDHRGRAIFRFCAQDKIYSFYNNRNINMSGSDSNDMEFKYEKVAKGCYESVGSSQGWLAYQVKRNLYLLDPTTYRIIQLPPLIESMWGEGEGELVHSVSLSASDEKQGGTGKAFMISGSGHLAFCSPGRSHEWTLLSKNKNNAAAYHYQSVVYSTRHRRLLCIASTLDLKLKLEAWDVGGESPPTLDNVTDFDDELVIGDNYIYPYIVCEEQSGKLFVVVRHVNYKYVPEEPTVGFLVYKVDREQRRLVKMEKSLEGLSMFVGTNDPVAIKEDVLRPNSIYITYDNRIGYYTFIGIYDYQKEEFSHLSTPDMPAGNPVWFTPSPAATM